MRAMADARAARYLVRPMKSEYRIGLFALLATCLLYFGLSAILSAGWQVQTQLAMDCEPSVVLPKLADFRSWQEWTTLAATERTDSKVEILGDAGKPGHAIVWRSNQNEAALRLVAVHEDGVDYEFTSRLGKDGKSEQIGRGSLRARKADGAGTMVTWTDESSVGTFVERWFVWFGVLQEKAREFQQASLSKLKQKLEAKPAAATDAPGAAK